MNLAWEKIIPMGPPHSALQSVSTANFREDFTADAAPHPGPLPEGEGTAIGCRRLAVGCLTSAVAGFSVRRRKILPLLEERAGVRSSHCFAPAIPLSISAPVAAGRAVKFMVHFLGLWLFAAGLALFAVLATGCVGRPIPSERQARDDLKAAREAFWPGATVPALDAPAGLSNYLQFAIMTQPQVRAAFFDWAASVERITVERSRPDPKLTFQAYIQNVLTSIMPGLMQDFPGPGKLKAAANVAGAESKGRSILRLKRPYCKPPSLSNRPIISFGFSTKKSASIARLNLLADLGKSARAQNEVGQGDLAGCLSRANRAGQARQRNRQSRRLAPPADWRSSRARWAWPASQPDPPMPATRLNHAAGFERRCFA
jgi:hypothetical protein